MDVRLSLFRCNFSFIAFSLFLFLASSLLAQPVYIAFYTIDTPYEEESKRLENSLKKFNLQYDFLGVPNLGSWQKNTQYKAIFIRDMLRKYPNRSIVYLDADAVVQQYPQLFDELDCDFAAHYYNNKKRNFMELLGGTLYFGPSEKAKALVDVWIIVNNEFPDQWDQKNLDIAVHRMSNLKLVELPPTYCLIFDLMKDQGPAVIEHFQASRRLKKIIDDPVFKELSRP